MLKKSLLMAASAAIVTCGAIGAANAGELKLTLRDVNVNLSENPDNTKHTDTDWGAGGQGSSVDINGFAGPNGSVAPREGRSIDKGFIPVFKPDVGPNGFTFEHVVLADERMGGLTNPVGGFYEIDVFEVTGAATFSEVTRFDIEIGGSALPMFKEDVNCANAIRAGSDNIHSLSANTASGGQSIHVGEMTANCNVTVSQGGPSTLPDRAIGWVLPIETKACGELVVSMTVTRQDPVLGGQIVDTFSHIIQECKDSLEAKFAGEQVKIDYFTDFQSFLLGEFHEPSLWARIGELTLDIHHWLVDLKEENKSSHTNVFDVSDIARWRLTLQFGNLRGIKSVAIDGRQADVLDRVANEARFTLTNAELRSLFCLETADGFDKGQTDWGCVQSVKIHAFGPHDGNINNGPIDHQLVLVEVSELDLTPDTCSGAHCVKFFTPEEEGEGFMLAEPPQDGHQFWSVRLGRRQQLAGDQRLPRHGDPDRRHRRSQGPRHRTRTRLRRCDVRRDLQG
ncbi:MAG: hypothetical protein HC850_08600 [Rhodomicrobium sp.]|nr:hypothetical protein [Rhodomicrobium sp.]